MPKYKMVQEKKCPHCGEMLDHIKEKRETEQFFTVTPALEESTVFENEYYYSNDYDFYEEGDIIKSEYYCPYCEENLSDDFFVEEIIEKDKILLNKLKNYEKSN